MNYWPAETYNLSECHEPLIGMVRDLIENGRKTAEVVAGRMEDGFGEAGSKWMSDGRMPRQLRRRCERSSPASTSSVRQPTSASCPLRKRSRSRTAQLHYASKREEDTGCRPRRLEPGLRNGDWRSDGIAYNLVLVESAYESCR